MAKYGEYEADNAGEEASDVAEDDVGSAFSVDEDGIGRLSNELVQRIDGVLHDSHNIVDDRGKDIRRRVRRCDKRLRTSH